MATSAIDFDLIPDAPDAPDDIDLGGGASSPAAPAAIDLSSGTVADDDPGAALVKFVHKSPMVRVSDGVTASTVFSLNGLGTNEAAVETIYFDFRAGGSAATILSLTDFGADQIILHHAPSTLTDVNIANNNLDEDAIDAVFTALPTVSSGTVSIAGNPGVGSQTDSIATGKGWTVIDSD